MNGFLQGKPKVLNDLSYNFIKQQDGYFVEIKITKVNKKRQFPLIGIYSQEQTRDFSNELEGQIIVVGKITLEDLIEYQQIEFEIIRGYYYNEGFNPKIKEVIKTIFEERLKQKAAKNPIQETYKLIMNSAYGRTILKENTMQVKYVLQKDYDKFITLHYNDIIDITKIINSEKYRIRLVNPISDHFNVPQVGSSMLEMSKRIMNEVMCLAEDNGIFIYYQDTDSMHIDDNKIDLLSKLYKEKYDRELIGKNMGQFHCDFNSDILKVDIKSIASIFLGKKIYLDILEGKDKDGIIKYDSHIRMKGVNKEAIINKIIPGKYENEVHKVFQIYFDLYNGKEYEFDLLEGKAKFKKNLNGSISSVKEFKRNIKIDMEPLEK